MEFCGPTDSKINCVLHTTTLKGMCTNMFLSTTRTNVCSIPTSLSVSTVERMGKLFIVYEGLPRKSEDKAPGHDALQTTGCRATHYICAKHKEVWKTMTENLRPATWTASGKTTLSNLMQMPSVMPLSTGLKIREQVDSSRWNCEGCKGWLRIFCKKYQEVESLLTISQLKSLCRFHDHWDALYCYAWRSF